jgi:hypothetical protein
MGCPNCSRTVAGMVFLAILLTSPLMAQIDPSIPLRVKPPQITNPLDNAIKIQQLQRLKLEQQQAQAEARAREEENTRAQEPANTLHLTMRTLMRPDVFEATGLERLSPQEMAILDAWVTSYSLNLSKFFRSQSVPASGEVIQAKISGDFEGWTGETIFALDNGQIWQQSSYAYTYHYAYRPDVLIFQSGASFKMKVDGVADTIDVKRLK